MSGVGQRLRSLLAKRRRWARDVRASMQIVEVMVVGLMIVGAVVAVSTMDVPVSRTEGFKETNEGLVNDSLASMARHPSAASDGALFGSILEEYVMESISGNNAPLMAYLNKTLPAGANYNVLMDNGYGPPKTLIESGNPPREAVAGSIQFVPKLAYTFMISDFGEYQGDFQMNVHALPISNGALLHDEGDSVEVAVTFHDSDDPTNPVTVRSFGSTALRYNDPNARAWPSVAMYVDVDEKNHFIDASGVSPYSIEVPVIGGEVLGDAYNISFDLALDETAGIEVPKDAQIRFQFPRLWDLRNGQRNYVESHPDLGNDKFWKDFEYESDSNQGLIVKARLKEPFAGEKIWFNMTADFMALIDSANPHFGTISVTMGDGVQGMSNIVVKQPGANMAGSLRREVYPSFSKPLIRDDTTTWGMVFANKGQSGDTIVVDAVDIRQPEGKVIFKDLAATDDMSWSGGTWAQVGPAHWRFTPDPADPQIVLGNGNAAWLSFAVTGGHTTDNNYRNENYLSVTPVFNPDNTTSGPNNLGEWEFAQRSFEMWEEWVYRTPVPPSDLADPGPPAVYVPGWPDEDGYEYWVTGGTEYRKAIVPANFTYRSAPFAASSSYAGDYQGSHVFSQLDLVDGANEPARAFALGEKVRIKNNFTAMWGKLSTINGLAEVTISDLRIDTYVYTPEMAWKGIPTKSFTENAGVMAVLQDISFLESGYVAEDDSHILVAVDSAGVAYGLDAMDGAKFWVHDTGQATSSVAMVDLDGDGTGEVLIGHTDGTVTALDIRPNPALASGRLQWTHDFANPNVLDPIAIGEYDVMDMVQVATDHATRPELVVTASPDYNDGLVYGVDVDFDGAQWTTVVHSQFQATDKSRGVDLRMQDLEPVWLDASKSGDPTHVAVASDNATVLLLDATDLSTVTWITDLYERPYRIHAADLDLDGADDLVVNTYDDKIGGETGKGVLVISGRTGNWGSDARAIGTSQSVDPFDVTATAEGGVFATASSMYVMQDTSALYEVGLAWPNMNSAESPFDVATIATKSWNGLHATSDGTVFIIETAGEIRATTDKRDLDDGYDWQRITPTTLAASGTFIDLHVAPDWATGGRIHGLDADGDIYAMDDQNAYVLLAALCDDRGVPHAGVTCGAGTKMARWRVQEDFQGDAMAIFALVNDGSAAGLYRYDVAAESWSTVQTWIGRDIADFHIAPDGTYHAAGSTISSDAAWLERKAPGGTWTSQTIMSPSGKLTSVLVNTAGDAFVSSDTGVVWRSSTEDTWTRVPIADMPAHKTALVETADGQVWALGRDYTAAPLYTHEESSWIYFPTLHDEIPAGEAITKMEIKAVEGHLGSNPAAPTQRTLTEVTWWYKTASVTDWTPVPVHDLVRTPAVAHQAYNVTLDCPDVDLCEDVQLRAHLRNRVIAEGGDPMRRDGGASPMIRDVKVTFYNGLWIGSSESIAAGPDVPAPGSTAIYTDAHQGYVTPTESHRAWTYVGATNAISPNSGNTRQIAVSSHSLTTGAAGADVMVTESASSGSVGLLLDGLTGGIKRPASGTTTWVTSGNDLTQRLLIRDMDGDGYEEVLGAGMYDDQAGAIRVWDLMDDTVSTSAGDGGTLVRDFVSLGTWHGKHHVAASTTQVKDAEVLNLITAVTGDTAGGEPTLLWTNDPSVAQGKATFVYDIGLGDMYGTAIVVSELVFTITDGGNQITQTARLLDWFNITPPNERVPNPPVYMVEVVSWFNEA